jgi:hypothetical protein
MTLLILVKIVMREGTKMATNGTDPGHGNSVAAWTAVILVLIGCSISTLAVWIADSTIFWAGVGVCVLGAIAGPVLSRLGYGVKSHG